MEKKSSLLNMDIISKHITTLAFGIPSTWLWASSHSANLKTFCELKL